MKKAEYLKLKKKLETTPVLKELEWASTVEPCSSKEEFLNEVIHVIINHYSKHYLPCKIADPLYKNWKIGAEYKNPLIDKRRLYAVNSLISNLDKVWNDFLDVRKLGPSSVLKSLRRLKMIDNSRFYLARNLGEILIIPERITRNIASHYNTEPFVLCARLTQETSDRLTVVNAVLFRSAEMGWIDGVR